MHITAAHVETCCVKPDPEGLSVTHPVTPPGRDVDIARCCFPPGVTAGVGVGPMQQAQRQQQAALSPARGADGIPTYTMNSSSLSNGGGGSSNPFGGPGEVSAH